MMLNSKLCFVFLVLFLTGILVPRSTAQPGPGPQLFLRNGTIKPIRNIAEYASKAGNSRRQDLDHKTLFIIQFEKLPGDAERTNLKDAGIELLDYIPDLAFIATVTGILNTAALEKAGGRSIVTLNTEQKISPELLAGQIPDYASKVVGKVDLTISYPRSFDFEEIAGELKKNDVEIISSALKDYQLVEVRISSENLKKLADLYFVQYITLISKQEEPLNDKSIAGTKANVLASTFSGGLDGDGVVIGVGDNADPFRHVDINNRIINNAQTDKASHGVHIIGTIAGAGFIYEKYKGYSPKSKIIVRNNGQIWREASDLVRDFGMVITNNSYSGSSLEKCGGFGSYEGYASVLDKQAFDLPNLMQVFAAGNSGTAASCPEYPLGYGNVLGEYASAKNIISVGQTLASGEISPYSSKGPVKDGRIKPEITAPGTNIYSTIPGDDYIQGTGTSMAAAGVSGGLGLLYQAYRKKFPNETPKNALIKALACNGASDKGLKGPDFSYGFGSMNLLRSFKMLDAKHFVSGQLGNGARNTHDIDVPKDIAQLKVMLYWNDPAASTMAGGKALVNNLDLTVKDLTGAVVLPLVPNAANVMAAAENKVDDLNNIEQVTIDKPAEGKYYVEVLATAIPEGVQEYFIVYDWIEVSGAITYPIGNERLTKSDVIYISWESYGSNGTFSVQYSLNNGTSWTNINGSVVSSARQLAWTLPDASTETAKVRILQNGIVIGESQPFTILGVPTLKLSTIQCEGFATIEWVAVKNATDYEIMILQNDEMKSVTTTGNLTYTFERLAKDVKYYFSVRARKNGIAGRRAWAVSRTPNDGNCLGNISDNDLKIDAILTPSASGRQRTSTALSDEQPIMIRVKNLDDEPSTSSFQVGYAVGDAGAAVHWETISPTVPAGATYDYTFTEKANFQNAGLYHLTVYVKKDGDVVENNNSLEQTFKQLANPVVQLPYLEKFENTPQQEVVKSTFGLSGLDQYDFESAQSNGRVRTFVGSNIAFSGNNALTLDVNVQSALANENRLQATFNLSSYNVQSDDIRLSFKYIFHGHIELTYQTLVWIRGKDSNTWIPAYGILQNTTLVPNEYQNGFVKISELLKANGQQFSESFQIKWGQYDSDVTLTKSSRAGYSVDDIQLVKAATDLQLARANISYSTFCGQTYPENIKVDVTNNDAVDCFNVTVSLKNDDGTTLDEIIPLIPAHQTASAYFSGLYASSFGKHNLKFSVHEQYDVKPDNDTYETSFYNSQEITVGSVYYENFESGAGGWRADGTNSSWKFGVPNSVKVAAAASGRLAWKTNLTGNHNNDETSYLYSPCFKIDGLQNPTLSFSTSLDLESCPNNLCDVAYVEYAIGNGIWKRLGSKNVGTNWYNRESKGAPAVWNVPDYNRWHVSTISLPRTSGQNLRLRFVLNSNASVTREGIAIDDIHIYDLQHPIYDGTSASSVVSNSVSANNDWQPFFQDNKIIASIRPAYQNLGIVKVQTFSNSNASVRSSNNQYYLDRNFTIKPEVKNTANPVTVRLYFLDSEAEKLISAPANSDIKKPASAYELSLSKYSDANGANEDGTLANDADKEWSLFAASDVMKVPYDKGYYAEFKIQSFSEFWLAKEFIANLSSLPVDLISFTAKKQETIDKTTAVALEWVTSSEKDFSHFEVETAIGSENARKGAFEQIGEVESSGNSAARLKYTFIDSNPHGTDIVYYRLKMVDTDKSFVYSPIRSVGFDEKTAPQVYPNPSNGLFTVQFQGEPDEETLLNVYDSKGILIKNIQTDSGGSLQKQKVDLSSHQFQPGLYLLELKSGNDRQVLKVIRN